jgi:hypothetical protein
MKARNVAIIMLVVAVIAVVAFTFKPHWSGLIGRHQEPIPMSVEAPTATQPDQFVKAGTCPSGVCPNRLGACLPEHEAAVEKPALAEPSVKTEAGVTMVAVQVVKPDTIIKQVPLDEYVKGQVAAQVGPLKKRLAAAEKKNAQLAEALQQPAVTVLPQSEQVHLEPLVLVESAVTPAKSAASGTAKLVAYFQNGQTYVSMEAVCGDPPYYRFGGTKNSGWSLDKTPLYPDNGWLVLNAEYDRFQIVSSSPDNSGQYWSKICETYQPTDLGVYIAGSDCLYSPIRR